MSGLPGRVGTWIRKRYPSRCSSERTNLSGLVFVDRIRAINALRAAVESGSAGTVARGIFAILADERIHDGKRRPMIRLLEAFHVDSKYSNEEIYRSFSVGNTGGVRVKTNNAGEVERIVIFTSVPTAKQLIENPYYDRLEGDVLVYTGAGKEGDQSVSGVNARILQQRDKRFPIHAFIQIGNRRDANIGNKRWAYLGLAEYLRCYGERQIDAAGKWRKAWIFELKVNRAPTIVPIVEDRRIMRELFDQHRDDDKDDLELQPEHVSTESRSLEFDIEILEPVRSALLAVDPKSFEYLIGEVLKVSGFEGVEVTRFSQDGGIDVNARPGRKSWPIRQLLIQLQAKRWLHTVGRKEVAELRGSLVPHASGCIVTTSHFSKAAIRESTEPGKVPITLVDGYELAHIVQSTGIKVNSTK